MFELGDKVEKSSGYNWPGVVVAVFKTTAGKDRFVVECTHPSAATGALHIYNAEQLRKVDNHAYEIEAIELAEERERAANASWERDQERHERLGTGMI